MTYCINLKASNSSKLLAFLVFIGSHAVAQNNKLEKIDLIYDQSKYRVMVQCDSFVNYRILFKNSPPRLLLYLRETVLNLPKRELFFTRGPVKEIRAFQWKTHPAIVKVSVVFNKSVSYELKNGDNGIVFIDLVEEQDFPHLYSSKDTISETQKKSNVSSEISHRTTLERSGLLRNSVNESAAGISNKYAESISLKDESTAINYSPLNNKELLSLDVREAEISNVLRMLARLSNLNIVASQNVNGKITVSLSNVTIKQALDVIVKANGYDYIVDGDVILVKPLEKFQFEELETKIYRLKYVDAKNLQSILTQALSPQAKIQVFYHDFQQSEGGGEGQKGAKKSRSSTLIVTDSPSNIKQVDAMVAALDVLTRQIMIEAKLIEISPQNAEKLGIDWSKTVDAQIFQEVILPSGSPLKYSVELPLEGGSISYGKLSFSQFNAVLDFLKSETNAKLVSNPRILAMDNQEAIISVGNTIPIPQINRGVGGQGDVVTFEYRDVNIMLRVTPHVSDDSTITLFVNPVIEEITGEVVAGENRAPITSKREVQTVVNIKSNETMVIGGLIKESTVETLNKVWFLGDVPLIGNLFRHKDKVKKQTDLLIFITPRLLE